VSTRSTSSSFPVLTARSVICC